MRSFNVTVNPLHKFDVVVPNFSVVNSLVLEIEFQLKMIADALVLLNIGENVITISNEIEATASEELNLPIEFKSKRTIDTKTMLKYVFWNENLKDLPIYIGNKVSSELYSKEPISSNIKSRLTMEIEALVAELMKLKDIDDLTWNDLDDKTLEQIYYKTV